LNFDDGGMDDGLVSGLFLEKVEVSEIGVRGNRDGIKCSGIRNFCFEKCSLMGWAGQGIDCVGCDHGVIRACRFEGKPGFDASAGVQFKGGSSHIVVVDSTFTHAGERPLNIGGSTALAYFRPKGSKWEASQITIENNKIEGGLSAIAFVGVNECVVRNNQIEYPSKWIFRTLQENQEPGFGGSQKILIDNNSILFARKEVSSEVNVGAGASIEEITFSKNRWYAVDNPSQSKPRLHRQSTNDVYGVDPRK
jgi:hypothetical protein